MAHALSSEPSALDLCANIHLECSVKSCLRVERVYATPFSQEDAIIKVGSYSPSALLPWGAFRFVNESHVMKCGKTPGMIEALLSCCMFAVFE